MVISYKAQLIKFVYEKSLFILLIIRNLYTYFVESHRYLLLTLVTHVITTRF
jgi:hypothetical protein